MLSPPQRFVFSRLFTLPTVGAIGSFFSAVARWRQITT